MAGAPAQFLFKPGERLVGRAVGTPNKLTAFVRNVLAGAFHKIGGEEMFVQWAKNNPTDFYCRLWIKLLPEANDLSDEERGRVLDAMMGVQNVMTQLYDVAELKNAEMVPTSEIDAKTQVDAPQLPPTASTDAPQTTISPKDLSKPAP